MEFWESKLTKYSYLISAITQIVYPFWFVIDNEKDSFVHFVTVFPLCLGFLIFVLFSLYCSVYFPVIKVCDNYLVVCQRPKNRAGKIVNYSSLESISYRWGCLVIKTSDLDISVQISNLSMRDKSKLKTMLANRIQELA
jgi:hypothetical protein